MKLVSFFGTLLLMKIMSKEVTFVCLGDSLTAGNPGFSGYGSWTGNPESQFSYWCQKYAHSDFPNLTANFENYGVGGDIVKQMLERYQRDVLSQLDHVDYVMVMGGNNDVVWRPTTPSECLRDLQELFTTILNHGSKVIALEILPVTCDMKLVKKIKETNKGMHKLCTQMKIPIIDLYDALADKTKNGLNKPYDSKDGEHLSVEGYRKVGEVIYTSYLKSLLSNFQ